MNVLDEKIEKAKNICIIGHINPDGDCIGSVLAVYNYIKNKYNDKNIVPYLSEFSKRFLILPNSDKIKNDLNDATIYDLAISLDVGSTERMKDYSRYFTDAKDRIVIDHHENNTLDADTKIVNKESIATCEMLYDIFDKEYIDRHVAECLYLGIATDSGVFRYKATNKHTFEIAGKLIEFGFDFTKLLDTIVFDNSVAQRKVQGIAFSRLKLLCGGRVSFSYLLDDEIDEYNLTKSDIDNVIVYLREIAGIDVAVFAYMSGNNIFKLSLRSKIDSINVAEFARMHDGGGHSLAAGCLYYGTIDDVEKNFTKDISEFIKNK